MSIEVKQLIIKSNVVNKVTEQSYSEHARIDVEQLKETLIEECKELIAENIHALQER